ncbi:MAG: hypothetical protein U0229_25560 [Anaeromyxobacter sp.]
MPARLLRTRSHLAAAAALALLAACSGRTEPAPAPAVATSQAPAFVNGGMESDAIGTTPPTGWVLQNYLNSTGVSGTATAPPSTFAALNLSGLGTAVNETYVVGGATLGQTDPDLGAGQTFRYPAYGARAARVNYKDAATYGKNKNANVLKQTMTVALEDVDPADGLVHVRFALAPVLENPSHSYNQQPFYYVELKNLTKGTTLYTAFNVAGQPGVPWKITTSAQTGNATQWLDWNLVDIGPGPAALSVGDQVQLVIVGSGCSLGGHFGRIYVDALGSSIPGPFVTASAPASVNAGATLTYTVRYTNGGTDNAVGAHLEFTTPPNTTFNALSGIAGCATPAASAAGTVSCPLGTLAPGASGLFTLTVNVSAAATGSIVAGTYSIGAANAPTLLGAKVTTAVNGNTTRYADVVVAMTAGAATVQPSQAFPNGTPLYTITVTNNSTTDQIRSSLGKSITFTDVVPSYVTGVTWDCTVPVPGSAQTGTATKCRDQSGSGSYSGTGNSIVLNPRLGYAGGQIQILVYGTISPSASGTLVNTAATGAPTGIIDPVLANNTVTVSTPVGTARTVSLTKSGGNARGTVTSAPAGISCGTACGSTSGTFTDGQSVALTASPTAGNTFVSWAGAVLPAGCLTNPPPTTCTFTVGASNSVTATFAAQAAGAAAKVYVYGGGTQLTNVSTAYPAPLQVVVTDANGLPVSGATVTYTVVPVNGAGGTPSSGTATTNANGVASVTATANATPGTYTITATSGAITPAATFTLTNVGPAATLTFVDGGTLAEPQVAPTSATFSSQLIAIVKDAAGNVVPGQSVTFTAPGSGASATLSTGGSFGATASIASDAAGLVYATAKANATTGSYTVSATFSGAPAPVAFHLQNVTTGPAAIFVVSGTPQTAPTSSAFGAPLVATVADASGNSLPNVTVNWAAVAAGSGATATLSAASGATDASGLASITATANATGGAYVVNATTAGVATPAVYSLTNDGGQTIQVNAGSPQTATVSTGFATTLQTLVLDASGAAVSGAVVTYRAPASGASVTFSGGSACSPASSGCRTATTNASGIAAVTATANGTSGSYTVSASTPNAPGTADFLLANQCTLSSQCGGAAPYCNTTTHACEACGSDAQCLGIDASRPYCDSGTGACVGCQTDAQCGTGTTPICSQATQTCAACASNAQCAAKDAATPYCAGNGACSAGYTITASAGANGTVSPSGSVPVAPGADQTFTMTPDAHHHVAGLTVDSVATAAAATYTFTAVAANHTFAATFAIDTYTITASAGTGGSISPSGATSVSHGGSQAYTITPSTGYDVADVLVDGGSIGAATGHTFSNVTAGHTISASFALQTFVITGSAGAGGTVSCPSPVDYGSSPTCSITPSPGYHVVDVLVDGGSVGPQTSWQFVSVTAGHTVSATFAIDTYTIASSAGANGSISPSGSTSVNHGGSQTYTITPSAGYHLATLTVDGAAAAAASSYTFSNVTAAHTIAVTFAIDTFTIDASAGAHGAISPSGVTTVSYGATQAYAITPDTGWEVLDVLVDGVSAGKVSGYTFSNVQATHVIAVTFKPIDVPITASAGPHGAASCPGTVPYGGDADCTVTPDAGYEVETLTDDGADARSRLSGGHITLTHVVAPRTLAATFTRAPGTACTQASDCGSGHCVDGVCCDTACTGQCEACDVAGHAGTCSPATGVPHGARAACATDGSACGGACDGADRTNCAYPTSSCRTASCTGGTATLAASCDGAGHCPAAQTQACAPYTCSAGACAGNCSVDSDCATGSYCAAGVCAPKLTPGSACGASGQCASGFCVDGVCCDQACGGQCQACDVAGHAGACTTVVGAPHGARPACATDGSACGGACDGGSATACAYPTTGCRGASCAAGTATLAAACDGAGHCPAAQTQPCAPYACGATACAGNCALDADCAAGNYCSAGVCTPKVAQGGGCSGAAQCASGQCVDGVCCDTACTGQCEACDVVGHHGACTAVTGGPHGARAACAGDGTACDGACDGSSRTACAFPGAAVTCRAGSCAAGVATLAATCDGAGHCPSAQTRVCEPYLCGATACAGTCAVDADCTSGHFCSAGVCAPQRPDGEACGTTGACTSGFCVDGVCCDVACAGAAEACNVTGHAGTCTATAAPGCRVDGDCPSGQYCLAGACQVKGDLSVFQVRGAGGCGSTGAGDVAPLGLAAVLLLALRRRRAAARAGVVAVALLAGGGAAAQTLDSGFVADRFQPRLGARDVLAVESAEVPEHLEVNGGLWLNYADHPLKLVAKGATSFQVPLVSSQSVLDVGASVGLLDRLEVAAVLPVVLSQAAGKTSAFDALPGATGAGLSDLRVTPKVRLLELGGLAVAASLPVTLPTGSGGFRSQTGLTATPTAIAEAGLGPVRVLANAGVLVRKNQSIVDVKVSDALVLGLAGEWRVTRRFAALASVTAEGSLSGGAAAWPAEAILAARFLAPRGLVLTAGAGAGLTDGYGAPDWRVLLAASFLPERAAAPALAAAPPAAPAVAPARRPPRQPRTPSPSRSPGRSPPRRPRPPRRPPPSRPRRPR